MLNFRISTLEKDITSEVITANITSALPIRHFKKESAESERLIEDMMNDGIGTDNNLNSIWVWIRFN